jgi:hypothetical protein
MRSGWRLLAVGTAVISAAILFAQGEEQTGLGKTAKKPSPPASNGPVTLSELYATTERLENGVRKVVLGSTSKAKAHVVSPDRPAKRSEVILEFHRIFSLAKPKFKFTPRMVKYDPKVLSVPTTDPARKPLESLVKYGFIGKVAPMATSTLPTITIPEYGDALGYFVARIGDLTHTPSAKWSPYLFNHKEN